MKTVPTAWFLQYQFVSRLYPDKVTFSDGSFNMVKKDWLFNKLYPFFRAELNRLGVDKWSKKFDCEDFARLFKVYASICHLNSSGTADGIAVGEIDYAKENDEYHCVNVAFTDAGLMYIEPQTGEELFLTTNEYQSIRRFRI